MAAKAGDGAPWPVACAMERDRTTMGPPTKLEGSVAAEVEAVEALLRELEELRTENRALQEEVERLEDAFGEQKVHIVGGYVVLTWPAAGGAYLGRCPTLHAVAKQATEEETLADVRRAMGAVFEAYETMGKPLPPEDVDA